MRSVSPPCQRLRKAKEGIKVLPCSACMARAKTGTEPKYFEHSHTSTRLKAGFLTLHPDIKKEPF